MNDEPVTNMEDYLKKYGYQGLHVVLSEFIQRAPEFPGDKQLAIQLGIMMGDLEIALRNVGEAKVK